MTLKVPDGVKKSWKNSKRGRWRSQPDVDVDEVDAAMAGVGVVGAISSDVRGGSSFPVENC